MSDRSDEETDDPTYADRRNFYKQSTAATDLRNWSESTAATERRKWSREASFSSLRDSGILIAFFLESPSLAALEPGDDVSLPSPGQGGLLPSAQSRVLHRPITSAAQVASASSLKLACSYLRKEAI
jgi:hypothetical protein